MRKKVDVDNVDFKSVGSSVKDGDFTIVDVIVENKKLTKDFTIKLRMKQLEDGTWRVLSISNLREFIKEVEKAKTQKLAEINKPIQEEINKKVQVVGSTISILNADQWGFSKALIGRIPFTFNSDKNINQINGILILTNNNVTKKTYKFKLKGDFTKGNKVVNFKWDLNPFIGSDNALVTNGINNYKSSVQIKGLHFSDGTNIELKTDIE